MRIGMSSSCFYPQETEASLRRIGEAGAKTAEIFFNAPSELEGALLRELCAIRDRYGMEIVSIHPFMSFAEFFYLFSDYRRRFTDSLELYKHFFAAGAALGAKWFVLHGATKLVIDKADYAERLWRLNETAKPFGMRVAHENVVRFVGEDPAFMAYLYGQLGDDFHMVLDLKQSRRAGVDPFLFIEQVGPHIEHVHISDSDAYRDCLPPGKGTFDFRRLFLQLNALGYAGTYMIELYRENFTAPQELTQAQNFLLRLLASWENE